MLNIYNSTTRNHSNNDAVKAAVVGVGYLGRRHAQKYLQLNNVELTAIVDTSLSRLTEMSSELQVPAYSDHKILPELGITCASVASTTTSHYEIALWLLENCVDVLVEKPLTVTSTEARKLIETARINNRILQVGHLERFNPAFCAVKKVLTKPMYFESRRIAQFSGRGHDVDVIRDLMIHDIDIVCHIVDKPVIQVDAVGVSVLTPNFDIANARVRFDGGAVANFTVSRAAFRSERSLKMFQPEVYISLDLGQKVAKIYTRKASNLNKAPLNLPEIDIQELRVDEQDALFSEIESFVQAVRTRSKPIVTGEDGLRAIELVEAIDHACQESLYEAQMAASEKSDLSVANLFA